MKKIALLLIILLSLLPLSQAMADEYSFTVHEERGYAYVILDDGNACIIDVNLSGDIAIPSRLGGHTVVCLIEELFEGRPDITSVTLPETITHLGLLPGYSEWAYVFSYCDRLTSIQVAEGNPSFCSVDGVLFSKDQTILYSYPCNKAGEEYHVPEHVRTVACTAFAANNHLRKVFLDGGSTTWYTYTFYADPDLTVYYPANTLSALTAKNFIANGLSGDTDEAFNRFEAVGGETPQGPGRLIGDNNGDGRVDARDGTTDPTVVYSRMMALKNEYFEGRIWTNNDMYILSLGNHVGYGCVAFAFILSDTAFGGMPMREVSVDYDQLLPGDILRINNDSHTVIILEKYDDYVVVAEGNFNSSIHWGRTLSRDYVMTADYVFTRYPENMSPQPDPAKLPGNVTGDEKGAVDGQDVLLLARYIAGDSVTIQQKAADVNGDGTVDGRDLLLLARYVAGENVQLKESPIE